MHKQIIYRLTKHKEAGCIASHCETITGRVLSYTRIILITLIFSGAVIERIQVVGFVILAIVLGSFAWVVAAAWGWHADGWLVTKFGVHDFGAAGLVHAVAGFFALGVLINLGPRIGKFNADGSANHIPAHRGRRASRVLNMPIRSHWAGVIQRNTWGQTSQIRRLACSSGPLRCSRQPPRRSCQAL